MVSVHFNISNFAFYLCKQFEHFRNLVNANDTNSKLFKLAVKRKMMKDMITTKLTIHISMTRIEW